MKHRLETIFFPVADNLQSENMQTGDNILGHVDPPFSLSAAPSSGLSPAAFGAENRPANQPSWLTSLISKVREPEPRIIFGLGTVDSRRTREAAASALLAGYRYLDMAPGCGHEEGVGWAVREVGDNLGLSREEICVSSKLPSDCRGYDATMEACEESLARLGLQWIDLWLIDWSRPWRDLDLEAWKAMVSLKRNGLVRAIGVVDCCLCHVDLLVAETGELPAVNQLEINPYRQNGDLCLALEQRAVPVETHSPFGDLCLADPLFIKLGMKHGRTPAQIILRWHLECGRGAVFNAARQPSLREYLNIFNFHLDVEDMRRIALLDRGEVRA